MRDRSHREIAIVQFDDVLLVATGIAQELISP
jgi:hypothetical protein